MSDRDRFELEMSPGTQPPSGFGDRVLVGLALAALIGGGVVAVGNVLRDNAELAHASAAPSTAPTRTPRPDPTPAPPRVVTVQHPDVEIPHPQQAYAFSGWIRANVDLVVRSSAQPDAAEVGVLHQGEIAYADEQAEPPGDPGWLYLQPPAAQGWIATLQGETQLVQRFREPPHLNSGYVAALNAGDEGFVALGVPPSDWYTYQPAFSMVSSDGSRWRSADPSAFDNWEIQSVAWGPAGWLAAGSVSDGYQSQIWIWRSAGNGLGWSRLGSLVGVNQEYVTQLSASDDVYLMQTSGAGGYESGGRDALWSSTDGITWHESVDPAFGEVHYGGRQTFAVPAGFYVVDDVDGDPATLNSRRFFTVDGKSWSVLESGPEAMAVRMSGIGNRVLAIDTDPTSLRSRVWTGAVEGRTLAWVRDTGADDGFAGAVVTALVADGRRTYAFGADSSTYQPLVWTLDGQRWVREELPDTFGGVPQTAAASPAGVVVVGHRPTLRGDNPIFWHRTATGGWLPEAEPVIAAVPDPSIDACSAAPADFLDFSVLDRAAAPLCFGDAPITLTAWSVPCQDCYGFNPGAEPAWLASPSVNQLYLSPIKADIWSLGAVVHPTLAIDPSWTGAWLEVTGHFDDPAALTCTSQPSPQDLVWWGGPQSVIDQCRQTFVVTGVTVVAGPD